MVLTPSLVETANNSFRYCRPDVYLSKMQFNRSAYIDSLINPYGNIRADIVEFNPRETVPAMVLDLVNNKSYTV